MVMRKFDLLAEVWSSVRQRRAYAWRTLVWVSAKESGRKPTKWQLDGFCVFVDVVVALTFCFFLSAIRELCWFERNNKKEVIVRKIYFIVVLLAARAVKNPIGSSKKRHRPVSAQLIGWWLIWTNTPAGRSRSPQNGDFEERETQTERGGSGGHLNSGRFSVHNARHSRGAQTVSSECVKSLQWICLHVCKCVSVFVCPQYIFKMHLLTDEVPMIWSTSSRLPTLELETYRRAHRVCKCAHSPPPWVLRSETHTLAHAHTDPNSIRLTFC